MTVESQRIADQIARAARGPAWHGPSMRQALSGVAAAEASARPVPGAHTIAEIVAHSAAWIDIVRMRLEGTGGEQVDDAMDWPPVEPVDASTWRTLVAKLDQAVAALESSVSQVDDGRLDDELPGVDDNWTAYASLHGVVQHLLYHAGQVILLRKAVRA